MIVNTANLHELINGSGPCGISEQKQKKVLNQRYISKIDPYTNQTTLTYKMTWTQYPPRPTKTTTIAAAAVAPQISKRAASRGRRPPRKKGSPSRKNFACCHEKVHSFENQHRCKERSLKSVKDMVGRLRLRRISRSGCVSEWVCQSWWWRKKK